MIRPAVPTSPQLESKMSRNVLLACLLGAVTASPVVGQNFRYEAETGNLVRTVFSNSVPGYSGTGYVTGFENNDSESDYVELQVDVPEGLYEMWVGYRSPYGPKGYDYQVDGELGTGMFDQTFDQSSNGSKEQSTRWLHR